MGEKDIYDIQKKVASLLEQQRLQEALNQMEKSLEGFANWELQTQYDEITTAYRYMLEYLSKGINDAERNKLHRDLIGRTFLLNDSVTVSLLKELSNRFYYVTLRRKNGNESVAPLMQELEEDAENKAMSELLQTEDKDKVVTTKLLEAHEEHLSALFYTLWTQGLWNAGERNDVKQLLQSLLIPANDLALAVSAVTLSLSELFDPQKVLFLCDAYESKETIISQRALVGLFLACYNYDKRIPYYPELHACLQILCDDDVFVNRLLNVQIQFLRSRETQKINRKMQEEIIPAMMKNPAIRNQKMGLDFEKEMQEEDINPDWEEWADKAGIKDKLIEMTELQMEGADVYMTTFSQLKGFSFFQQLPNWFRQFEVQQPDIQKVLPTKELEKSFIIKAIANSSFFCNSDKYSFFLAMQQIPEEQRNAFVHQIEEQNDAQKESSEGMNEKLSEEKKAEMLSNQYIQDLYRFFKLYPRRYEFLDPFQSTLNLQTCNTLATAIQRPTVTRTIAEYFLKKGYYEEAYESFSRLTALNDENYLPNAELYQKAGYCLQKMGLLEMALEDYQKADILKPDSLWNLRHLAQCCRLLKKNEEALTCYLQAESIEPENLSLLLQTGECMVQLRQYDEAFARFFKVEYLDSKSSKAWRAIGWCSFVTGKLKQAQKYYLKLLNRPKPLMVDYLNAGHVAWASGENAMAVEYYYKALSLCKQNKDFFEQFYNDKEDLLAQGIDENDIPLMRDAILYRKNS